MTSNKLTLGSLFDGIGGFMLAGQYAGIQPIWSSEIEPFPIRVTEKRFPEVQQLGDVRGIRGDDIQPVDIITFGSPCTELSIAGKRTGLEGVHSSLFFEAIRIIREMRRATNGQYPRWVCWENVPGALSSGNQRDYREVLESLLRLCDGEADVPMPESGRWLSAGEIMGRDCSLAWRVLDAAQGWGVAQRRKRVFVVLDLAGQRAGKVLFESEGMSGYSPPRREAWKGAAGTAEAGAGETGEGVAIDFNPTDSRIGISEVNVCQTLTRRCGTGGNQVPLAMMPTGRAPIAFTQNQRDEVRDLRGQSGALAAFPGVKQQTYVAQPQTSEKNEEQPQTSEKDEAQPPLTLKIRGGRDGGGKGALLQTNLSATLSCNNDQTLFEPLCYGICSDQSNAMLSDNPNVGFYRADTTRTLDTGGGDPRRNQGGMIVLEGNGARPSHLGDGYKESETMYTLNTVEQHSVCIPVENAPSYCMTVGCYGHVAEEKTPTLEARGYKDPPVVGKAPTTRDDAVEYIVRRLTPLECCRLQGYPDGWTENLGSPHPSEDEIRRWTEIFVAWQRSQGKREKAPSRARVTRWLMKPASDAAEYKAYGNSVAVPCVHFVLAGIVWAENGGETDEQVLEMDEERGS